MSVAARLREAVAQGELRPDAGQDAVVRALDGVIDALKQSNGFSWFGKAPASKGLYIWGDVGRGKTLLMDLFLEEAEIAKKRRAHFNAFMTQTHARIHAERQSGGGDDPIAAVARLIAGEARLLAFDEFQVSDVADAMILGRLFERLFAEGVVIVATSNTAPDRLYEGGLNRQLFLPFIAEIERRMEVIELNGSTDYRLQHLSGLDVYLTPLGRAADAGMEAAWKRLTAGAKARPAILTVLGRKLTVPLTARGVARFSFDELCAQPLAAPDYLAIAQDFHTVLIDHIPVLSPQMRNEARRFVVLIDTLYDEGVKLICSAAAPPDALYPEGDGADAFRRAASRLAEMRSEDYLRKGHGIHSEAGA
ncbi:MAG TPA: cell division protein ZapE [Rhizomicrobium sp.]|jgi:cell division protein ZapE|nr:cell division protein ZapE [Rhizomicrobium sp.]